MAERKIAAIVQPRTIVMLVAALLGLRSVGAIVTHIRLFEGAYQVQTAALPVPLPLAERVLPVVDAYGELLYGEVGLSTAALRLWLAFTVVLAALGIYAAWLLFRLRSKGRFLVFALIGAHIAGYIAILINALSQGIRLRTDPRDFGFCALYVIALTWPPVKHLFTTEGRVTRLTE